MRAKAAAACLARRHAQTLTRPVRTPGARPRRRRRAPPPPRRRPPPRGPAACRQGERIHICHPLRPSCSQLCSKKDLDIAPALRGPSSRSPAGHTGARAPLYQPRHAAVHRRPAAAWTGAPGHCLPPRRQARAACRPATSARTPQRGPSFPSQRPPPQRAQCASKNHPCLAGPTLPISPPPQCRPMAGPGWRTRAPATTLSRSATPPPAGRSCTRTAAPSAPGGAAAGAGLRRARPRGLAAPRARSLRRPSSARGRARPPVVTRSRRGCTPVGARGWRALAAPVGSGSSARRSRARQRRRTGARRAARSRELRSAAHLHRRGRAAWLKRRPRALGAAGGRPSEPARTLLGRGRPLCLRLCLRLRRPELRGGGIGLDKARRHARIGLALRARLRPGRRRRRCLLLAAAAAGQRRAHRGGARACGLALDGAPGGARGHGGRGAHERDEQRVVAQRGGAALRAVLVGHVGAPGQPVRRAKVDRLRAVEACAAPSARCLASCPPPG